MSDSGSPISGRQERVEAKHLSLMPVRAELALERATGLGLAAKSLRVALAAVAGYDRGMRGRKGRARLVDEAAKALASFLAQREAMGLDAQDVAAIRREYAIPLEVWDAMPSHPRG